jgi:hypothetical protein
MNGLLEIGFYAIIGLGLLACAAAIWELWFRR